MTFEKNGVITPPALAAQKVHQEAVHQINRFNEKLVDLQRDGVAFVGVPGEEEVRECRSEAEVRAALGFGGAS